MSINFSYAWLNDLADETGVEPVYLEKDLVLTTIIRTLASGPLAENLVLKGGQALRHIYGSPRLSKDVDYVARKRMEFADLSAALDIKYPRLKIPAEPIGRTGSGFLMKPISYRGPLGVQDNVELEVSFRGDLILDPVRTAYENPFYDPFDVLVMSIHEIVSEKVRAMYQRGNPRDLFDLWFIFSRANVVIDFGKVNDLIPRKFDPDIVAGGWNRGRLFARIREQENEWAGALKALVPAADRVSFDEALSAVEAALRPLRR